MPRTRARAVRSATSGQLSFTSEVMHFSGQHGAPNIDAIGHIGRDGKLFGGVDAAKSTEDPDGIGASGVGAQLAIDQFPKDLLINRGVLLDVASMIQGNLDPLPADFEITAKHLAQAADRQRVKLRKGDIVFIRTGWGPYFTSDPATYAGAASPGPGLDAAEFLIRHGARVVGNDTLTFEKRPPLAFPPQVPKFQVFPVHMRLITDKGIYIIENLEPRGSREGAGLRVRRRDRAAQDPRRHRLGAARVRAGCAGRLSRDGSPMRGPLEGRGQRSHARFSRPTVAAQRTSR